MNRNHDAPRSTRPTIGATALIAALLAASLAGCGDAGVATRGSGATTIVSPSVATSVATNGAGWEPTGVTTVAEWCAVVRQVDVALDDVSLDAPLEQLQPIHSEVLALSEQLIVGIDAVDAEYRDDVVKVLEGQQMLSRIVVNATDPDTMRAEFEGALTEAFVVADGTYEWVGTTCGLDNGTSADAASSGDAPTVPAASHGNVRVIVDQSPTVSDIGALGFLAARPDVELLAVTMPGTGEAECSAAAATTRAVLDAAGEREVPIGCGGAPLEGTNEWPTEWRRAADALAGVVAPGSDDPELHDAEAVLIETLGSVDEPVTIVALGPLTNIAAVLETDPSLAGSIEQIVVMGGAVSVDGNVEPDRSAEWNFHAHPSAARVVIDSGVQIALVPLDATNHVALTSDYVAGVASIDNDLARVQAAVQGTLAGLDFMFMWDELTAVLAVQPEAASWSERSIVIDDEGATIESVEGTVVQVAMDADAASVRSILLGALNEFDG